MTETLGRTADSITGACSDRGGVQQREKDSHVVEKAASRFARLFWQQHISELRSRVKQGSPRRHLGQT